MQISNDVEFRRPLYYFSAPGIFIVVIGIVEWVYFLQNYSGSNSIFMSTSMMILLVSVGLFLVFTGIILHEISNLLDNSNFWNTGLK